MTEVLAGPLLANGLRTDFWDTYTVTRNRVADSNLSRVMDLGVPATNRRHEFGYFEAAPHATHWQTGDTIPTAAMDSVQFSADVYPYARRVPWHKYDREDEQTQSLVDAARAAGESFALLPERLFFDLLTAGSTTIPAVNNAPDGVAMFSATDGASAARFGVSGGNIVTGNGATTIDSVQTDYYGAIRRFLDFQDGQGQPLLMPEVVAAGVTILFPLEMLEVMEQTFLQRRQGISSGSGSATVGLNPSNLVQDASRNVHLWPSPRLTDTGDWYVFLNAPPKMSTFLLDRSGIQEFTAFEGDNNSDSVRDTGVEYIQWEQRLGAQIALPYAAIKVNN